MMSEIDWFKIAIGPTYNKFDYSEHLAKRVNVSERGIVIDSNLSEVRLPTGLPYGEPNFMNKVIARNLDFLQRMVLNPFSSYNKKPEGFMQSCSCFCFVV